MQQVQPLSEEELNEIYNWLDEISFSRPKKSIARDFSNGVLMAELIHHYMPRVIEIHNYTQSHSTVGKLYNWETLNNKAFRKMGFQITSEDIDNVVNARPDGIESVLKVVKLKIQKYLQRQRENPIAYSTPKQQLRPSQKSPTRETNGDDSEQRVRENKGSEEVKTDKDKTIQELRGTAEILELKVKKLEQLAILKESKIQALQEKLHQHGLI